MAVVCAVASSPGGIRIILQAIRLTIAFQIADLRDSIAAHLYPPLHSGLILRGGKPQPPGKADLDGARRLIVGLAFGSFNGVGGMDITSSRGGWGDRRSKTCSESSVSSIAYFEPPSGSIPTHFLA